MNIIISIIKKLFHEKIFLSVQSNIALLCLLALQAASPLAAQNIEPTPNKPSWWFGMAAGANLNFYQGSTYELNESFTPPQAFKEGFGTGLYLAPTFEYYQPNSMFGLMIQLGYDNRRGTFNQIITTCNCPADLSTNISYFSLEPSLRFFPFRNSFFIYGGPRFAYNYQKSFVYQLGINPDFPEQTPSPEIKGDLSSVNQILFSGQIGAGFDIPISSQSKRTQFVLSPFVAFHPYFGQDPRDVNTLNISTVRVGAALKFGIAKKRTENKEEEIVVVEDDGMSDLKFEIYSPKNIPAERTVRETFPLRNYVFFDLGSTDIPDRYVKIEKSEVNEFNEEQVVLYTPKDLSGRSNRQLIVYYNILNILGDRMIKNPTSAVKLVGSSENNAVEGREMAESIKTYLVDVFSIQASRITTEGRDSPKIPSRQEGGENELTLLRQGDRRVSIESNSPALLMEFHSGPAAPLKPLEVSVTEKAPIDSYLTFENNKAEEKFEQWMIEVKDESGNIQTYGPFTENKVSIPGKDILGNNAEGDYQVKMIGITKEGKKIEKQSTVHMVLWQPAVADVSLRFSVIYEFDESTAINIYEKYLTEVVANKIPKNAFVIIHGHTDIIGNAQYNEKLSYDRAMDVKGILERILAKQNRDDVEFEVIGFGEDQRMAPFENKYPEERFYNRTVVIDIIPRS